ncbi:MAG: hypothetical protein K2G93_00415 [Rikenella sp.]|nr:hypothetical protein [Rikenella sp.]
MLYSVGRRGYNWGSTSSSGTIGAHYLHFYYGGIYPNYSDYRANALQLRCLQE